MGAPPPIIAARPALSGNPGGSESASGGASAAARQDPPPEQEGHLTAGLGMKLSGEVSLRPTKGADAMDSALPRSTHDPMVDTPDSGSMVCQAPPLP